MTNTNYTTPRAAYACKLPVDLYKRVLALREAGFSASGWLAANLRPYVLHALAEQHKLAPQPGPKTQLTVYLPVDLITLQAPLRAHRQGSHAICAALSAHIEQLDAQFSTATKGA